MSELTPSRAIAIIGLAGRFPSAPSLDDFWRNIRDGVETLETLTEGDLEAAGVPLEIKSNPYFVRKCSALDQVEYFDANFFGITGREAQILDPQHRLFLECAWEALEHAGYSAGKSEQSVGVYAGVSMNSYLWTQIVRDPALVANVGGYQLMLGNDKDFLCTRVSYKLDLRGPSLSIQTACSTSLVAVEVACRALQHRECDVALAGGVSVTFPRRAGYLYEEGMILSPDGHCRPFDAEARGTHGGEGVGIVVLKRLADAIADRDTIHAVIRGAAINNDGAGKAGYTAPSVDGQVEVIALAQALAGVEARTISYVETHGTGTPLGDPIEIAALAQAFRASTSDVAYCRIGSLKANLGHLDAAAGIASLIKTVLALKHRYIPPLVNFRKANPELKLDDSPFIASSSGSPWTADGSPRRAGVSSFGIGGTNAHLILEEAPAATLSNSIRNAHLLVVSAKTSTALEQATANLAAHLKSHADLPLIDVGWTLGIGRRSFLHRRVVVAKDATQAAELLSKPQPVLTGTHEGSPPTVAFLFSGQGAQHPRMGADLYASEPIYKEAIDRCAAVLRPTLDFDIRSILFDANAETDLNETRFTQPLLFATEYALASQWMHWGIKPSAMLGHSIGEYVAAHLAGVMSLEDALKVVAERGRLMQAMPPGSMAAVHCAPSELGHWLSNGVEIAAVNAPDLCTVSGPTPAITELLAALSTSGVAARILNTSRAFHSSLMEPALSPFVATVKSITLLPPCISYISNVTGKWITDEQATSPDYYATHLRRAVQFEAGVRTIAVDPTTVFLEVGPGTTLTSMVRLIVGKEKAKYVISSLPHRRNENADDAAMLEAAGRMWLAGVELDWTNLHAGASPQRIPLPTYPFERKWYGVNPPSPTTRATKPIVPEREEDIGDWLFSPTWTRESSHLILAPRLEGPWLLLAQPSPLAEVLVDRLRAAGAHPVVVESSASFQMVSTTHFRARPGQSEDIASIAKSLQSEHPIQGAIYLGSGSVSDVSADLASYRELVAIAEGLDISPSGPPLPVIVATFGAESVLSEPAYNPAAALTHGPILVLPTEVPQLRMRAVDFEPYESPGPLQDIARALVEEAANPDLESIVAWRNGRRWMRRFERLSLPSFSHGSSSVKRGGVYLITGGLGGIGLTLAQWFAANTSVRLVLTARTPIPPRETWSDWLAEHAQENWNATIIQTLREIEQMGSEVITIVADAADATQMQRAIDLAFTRWGTIDGVVHAAGVPGTGRISFLKQPEDLQSVLAPKINGLEVLVRLLGDRALDFVVLMSSISSILGAPGLADYTAANAVLDAFPDSKLCPPAWKKIISINWGPWRERGMAARLHADQQSEAYRRMTIGPMEGADTFARVLNSQHKRAIVVPFNLISQYELSLRKPPGDSVIEEEATPPATVMHVQAVQSRPETSNVYEPPSTETERRLIEIWAEVIGVDPIGIDDNFFELGGHSLLATRVLARIDRALSVRLSLRNIFEAPTVRGLAAHILRHRLAAREIVEEREEIEF